LFDPGKYFQPDQILQSNTGAYPSAAHISISEGPWKIIQFYNQFQVKAGFKPSTSWSAVKCCTSSSYF